MGKIANALKKFSQERKAVRLPGLTGADFDVLLAYDRKTGHLKNYDRGSDQMSNAGAELLRNRGTVKRLLENKLIFPGGKLTPKGLQECERLQHQVQAPPPGVMDTFSVQNPPVEVTTQEPAPVTHEIPKSTQTVSNDRSAGTPSGIREIQFKQVIKQELNSADKGEQASGQDDDSPFGLRAASREAVTKKVVRDLPDAAAASDRFDEKSIDKNLVALFAPQSYEAEQFKILRTSILFPINGLPPQTILVTSALPGEGKSFVAANLAISIALNINKYVLLIDADLRKPVMHRKFGFKKVPGLTDFLSKHQALSSLLLKTKVEKLMLLPGGSTPPNPSELISTERMSELIQEVRSRYNDRFIVIDSPPTGPVAETSYLARQVDGILAVVKYNKTPQEEVEKMMETLGSEKIIGCIINYFDQPARTYYGYKKYSNYGKRYQN